MINITGIDLKSFVKKVYELSVPQGIGFLHFTPNPLSDKEAEEIIELYKNDKRIALSMDYVNGRACKMTVYKQGNELAINDNWYDHTDSSFQNLLDSFGIKRILKTEHNSACNCIDCQKK
jgi:hypothetical protein